MDSGKSPLFSMFNVDSWTGCGKSLIYQLSPLSTSPSSLLWLALALSNCVHMQNEEQV